MRFVDTLSEVKKDVVKTLNTVLRIWSSVFPWLPADVRLCRSNFCRQGCDLSCGYFVAWFLEEECRRSLGELPFCRGGPNADDIVKRMIQLARNLFAMEKRMQEALGSTLWKSEAPVEVDLVEDSPKIVKMKKMAMDDLKSTLLKSGDEEFFPGVDVPFPLKDFEGLQDWAEQVQTILTDKHRADVEKVRSAGKLGCAACRFTTCSRCYWPKTVRYWRRLETKGRFADEEGYSRMMKQPTVMIL